MYTLFEVGQLFTELNDQSRRFGDELLSNLKCLESGRVISSGENLLDLSRREGHLFLLVDGSVSFTIEDRMLAYFEQGDLIGLEEFFLSDSFTTQAVISSDFGVAVDVYGAKSIFQDQFDKATFENLVKFLSTRSQIYSYLMRFLIKDDVLVSPEIRHFESGETILSQGAVDDDVYTLVEGKAEAFVDGHKVGDILRDEIFGMLAAITKAPRTATVVAAERCMVVVVPKDKFINLVRSRPESILKVLEDMGRMIVDLNNLVIKSAKSKS